MHDAVCRLMKHQAVFGTVFSKNADGSYSQRYDPSKIKLPEIEKMNRTDFEALINSPFKAFDLFNEPLASVRIIVAGLKINVLMVFHHLVFDASSLQLIGKNFERAFKGKELETDTYFSFLAEEKRIRTTEVWQRAKEYYAREYDGIDWCWDIPHDLNDKGTLPAKRVIGTSLTPDKIAEAEKRSGTTRGIICGAMLLLALAKLSGSRKVCISSMFHGRNTVLKQHAAGFVASHIAVGVDLDECHTLAELYALIEKKSSEGIINSAFDWCAANSEPYVSEPIDMVYDSEAMTDTSLINRLGVEFRELDPHLDRALKIAYLLIRETAKDITLTLIYTSSLMSDRMIDRFSDAIARIADVMTGTDDPKNVRVDELISGLEVCG